MEFIIGLIFGGFLGFIFGMVAAIDYYRRQAIEVGLAEWISDKHGKLEFKWIVSDKEVSKHEANN